MNGKDLLDIMSQVDDDLILKTEIPLEKRILPLPLFPSEKHRSAGSMPVSPPESARP